MLDLRYGISSIAVRQMLGGAGPGPVEPGETLITAAGAGEYVVPNYNTLTIEGFGPGAGGGGVSYNATANSVDAGDTKIASLGLIAGGGKGSAVHTGGIATGWDININGGNANGNDGGDAAQPGGGLGGLRAGNNLNGRPGSAPGGGGSGTTYQEGPGGRGAYGGGGGSKGVKTYTFGDVGAPRPGDILAYEVGAGSAGGNRTYDGGKGADGQLKFIVA